MILIFADYFDADYGYYDKYECLIIISFTWRISDELPTERHLLFKMISAPSLLFITPA